MFVAMLTAAALSASAYPDPIAPAARGQMQCYSPNTAAKSCKSLAIYTAKGNGTFANTVIVLVKASPVTLLETVADVTMRDGAVCGAITEANIRTAKLSANAQAVPPEQAAPFMEQLVTALTPVLDRDICTRYEGPGPLLTAKATMDGVPQPDDDQTVLWVSASDGYAVKP
ncbi:hypothetical protein [Asticcacaulis benevestitus]|uniref:Uncharacterized protein n=1 Tax=Asticcacaulis benevestitus DSM 16100 = ATCC BAA-896 TaxID=1121022 RepID=V4Q3E3_9CAUL|nr:hypothetical protein [Asticcacaulis benevestitus]ESQ94209.1 hypothetical protein ABENE_01495 [Asticcacaulis benevestitus DSM 16100 = ATCC BAA-896]